MLNHMLAIANLFSIELNRYPPFRVSTSSTLELSPDARSREMSEFSSAFTRLSNSIPPTSGLNPFSHCSTDVAERSTSSLKRTVLFSRPENTCSPCRLFKIGALTNKSSIVRSILRCSSTIRSRVSVYDLSRRYGASFSRNGLWNPLGLPRS